MTMAQLASYGQPNELPDVMPPALPIYFPASQGEAVYSSACILVGYSLHNTGAATQTIRLRDGTDATGAVVAFSTLATGATDTQRCGDTGIILRCGLYVTSGAVAIEGSAWIIPL